MTTWAQRRADGSTVSILDRDKETGVGQGEGSKACIHPWMFGCGAHLHLHLHTCARRLFWLHPDDSSSGALSHCDNHCSHAISLPKPTCHISQSALFQPRRIRLLRISDLSSFCHDSSPPTTSKSKSKSPKSRNLQYTANTTYAARMWRRLFRESLHSASRLCRGSPKRDEGKSNSEVGSRDPIVRFYGALFVGLKRSDRGLERRTEHNPTRHRASPRSIWGLQAKATLERSTWEYSPLAASKRRDMLLFCATCCEKDKSTSAFGQHAARASSNYTCMQYFARGAAGSMLLTGKVPQIRQQDPTGKDFACSCTQPRVTTQKKNRWVACLRSCRSVFRLGQR
jgi:hypothetical protein